MANEAFVKASLQKHWEKIAVKITTGWTSFSDDLKILFSEWPIDSIQRGFVISRAMSDITERSRDYNRKA